ncbi:ABC transporter permease, partial [Streptomyces sp. NPDC057927]
KRLVPALITAAVSALMFVWYATTSDVPKQVVSATPYIVTLLVLSLSAQHLRMPKADGMPYRRGQGK